MSEINPCSSAHLLVNGELGACSSVIYGIACVRRAVCESPVRDVNGIPALFGDVGNPFGAAFSSFPDTFRHSAGPFLKRIFKIDIVRAQVSESGTFSRAPAVRCRVFDVVRVVPASVVIDDNFCCLYVTLARDQHIRTGIFEHRNQIRQHKTLRIQIFYGLEGPCTLPFPAV